MTLEDLLQRFRVLANDREVPYLWSNEDVAAWLSDAEAEAAVRARLLFDDASAAVCVIPVLAQQQTYPLHPKLYELVGVRFRATVGDTRARRLKLVTREWLDDGRRDWHEWERERPDLDYAIQDERTIRLVGVPRVAGVLTLEGYRLPLRALEDDDDVPEIHEAHHIPLLQWALHQAFSVPDADKFDPNRSQQALAAFERYFGLRPDADLRRSTRIDVPQHNVVHLP